MLQNVRQSGIPSSRHGILEFDQEAETLCLNTETSTRPLTKMKNPVFLKQSPAIALEMQHVVLNLRPFAFSSTFFSHSGHSCLLHSNQDTTACVAAFPSLPSHNISPARSCSTRATEIVTQIQRLPSIPSASRLPKQTAHFPPPTFQWKLFTAAPKYLFHGDWTSLDGEHK